MCLGVFLVYEMNVVSCYHICSGLLSQFYQVIVYKYLVVIYLSINLSIAGLVPL